MFRSTGQTTGKESIHSTWNGIEIMFHVSTMIPPSVDNVERKKHIGNDVVVIVFREGNTPFNPRAISSHYIRIFYPISALII